MRAPRQGREWVGRAGAACLLAACVLAAVGVPAEIAAAPGEASRAGEAIALDDLVRMLEEGVPPGVVRDWLAGRPGALAEPGPDDLIRLRRAGADEPLLRAILERARREGRSPADAPTPPTAGPAAGPATPPAVGRVPGPAGSAASATSAAGFGSDGTARIDLALEYRPVGAWEGDGRGASPDLVLFVDGRPLARLAPQGDIGRRPVRFGSRWPSGPRVVRWAVAVDDRGGEVLRVSPDRIVLEPDDRPGWELRFRWLESAVALGPPDPLDWTWLRDGEEVRTGGEGATARDAWPELCDDLRATLGGAAPSRRERRRLATCVSWADWWDGLADLPGRETVRGDRREQVVRPFEPDGERPADDR